MSVPGWIHNRVQMERQRLLLPPVAAPVVQGHRCGIFGDFPQTTSDPVEQLPEARSVPVEQGPEAV